MSQSPRRAARSTAERQGLGALGKPRSVRLEHMYGCRCLVVPAEREQHPGEVRCDLARVRPIAGRRHRRDHGLEVRCSSLQVALAPSHHAATADWAEAAARSPISSAIALAATASSMAASTLPTEHSSRHGCSAPLPGPTVPPRSAPRAHPPWRARPRKTRDPRRGIAHTLAAAHPGTEPLAQAGRELQCLARVAQDRSAHSLHQCHVHEPVEGEGSSAGASV